MPRSKRHRSGSPERSHGPLSVFDLARLLVELLPTHTDCLHPSIIEYIVEPSWNMSATMAREKYALTLTDLKVLKFSLATNPKNRKFAPMKLYKEIDLYRLALKKHKSAIGFERALNKRQKRSEAGKKAAETRKSNEVDKRAERREELESAMEKFGMIIPSQSNLCEEFLSGKGENSADEIVQILRECEFARQYTNYSEMANEDISMARSNYGHLSREDFLMIRNNARELSIQLFINQHQGNPAMLKLVPRPN